MGINDHGTSSSLTSAQYLNIRDEGFLTEQLNQLLSCSFSDKKLLGLDPFNKTINSAGAIP